MSGYSLYDIVDKLVGGDIQPVGETNYDHKAFDRQLEIQKLADYLIDDIFRITECKGNESSVELARNRAFGWFNELIEMLEDNFDLRMVRKEVFEQMMRGKANETN